MILTKLRTMDESKIADLYDVSEGLESRILEKCITSTNLNELKQDIKSKRYSLTRINRILLYSLFNLDKKYSWRTGSVWSFVPSYLRFF